MIYSTDMNLKKTIMFKNVVEKRVTSSQSDFSKVMLFMLSPEEYMLITQVIVAWERILDK